MKKLTEKTDLDDIRIDDIDHFQNYIKTRRPTEDPYETHAQYQKRVLRWAQEEEKREARWKKLKDLEDKHKANVKGQTWGKAAGMAGAGLGIGVTLAGSQFFDNVDEFREWLVGVWNNMPYTDMANRIGYSALYAGVAAYGAGRFAAWQKDNAKIVAKWPGQKLKELMKWLWTKSKTAVKNKFKGNPQTRADNKSYNASVYNSYFQKESLDSFGAFLLETQGMPPAVLKSAALAMANGKAHHWVSFNRRKMGNGAIMAMQMAKTKMHHPGYKAMILDNKRKVKVKSRG